jgi:hypothetical protein
MSPIERSPAYFATRLTRFGTTTVHAGSSHLSLDGAKARGGQGIRGLNSRPELVLCVDEIHRHYWLGEEMALVPGGTSLFLQLDCAQKRQPRSGLHGSDALLPPE